MKKGFTLIETLVVCAIFGIVILTISSFLSKEMVALKKGEKNVTAERIVREILNGRLTGKKACPGIIPEFRLIYLIVGTGTDWITFVNSDTNGDRQVTQADENITYSIMTTEAKAWLFRADDEGSRLITDKLLYNPPEYGFKLRYYDTKGSETGTLALIRKIEVKVMIDTDMDKKVDAELTSVIRPRNLPFP